MAKQIFETGKAPLIEVAQCAGDLVVRTWQDVTVSASGEYEFENVADGIIFQSTGDLRLDVPEGTSLRIGSISGDLVVKNIRGELSINEVHGDAILTNLGAVKINKIRSDLSAKNLMGPLSVESIAGDAVIRNIDNEVSFVQVSGDLGAYFINGAVYLEKVGGDINLRTINGAIVINAGHRDLNVRNLGGQCSVEMVHGDIRLLGGLAFGKHRFTAEGDIVVRWPTNAPLDLIAKAPEIRNKLPLLDVKKLDDGLIGHLGDGDAVVALTAGGRILLKESQLVDEKWNTGPQETFEMDFIADLANIGERVSEEVNHQMARMTNHLENYFGSEFAQNISDKVSKHADRAAQQAEKAAEKARKYANREAARAERQYQRSTGGRAASASPQTGETRKKASTEEQLKILKMVEKGTISPDEASILLEALEG